jgi:hypothetical protein
VSQSAVWGRSYSFVVLCVVLHEAEARLGRRRRRIGGLERRFGLGWKRSMRGVFRLAAGGGKMRLWP